MSIIYPSSETAATVNRAIKNVMGTTTTTDGAVDDGLIISENLQPVVECTPGMDYKITDKTITGTPPLSFHAIAQHLFDWSIDGNTDSGNSVGDKTVNLFNAINTEDDKRISIANGATYNANGYSVTDYIEIESSTRYTHNQSYECYYALYDENKQFLYGSGIRSGGGTSGGYTNAKYLRIDFLTTDITTFMIIKGTTAPTEYIPYGYDIPIIVNNTDTYHCYITDVLRKSSGDTPVYDTMNSDGTIIRRVDTDGTPLGEPITETYTASDITVNWGWNTVDVDTTVSPSNMIINYKDD